MPEMRGRERDSRRKKSGRKTDRKGWDYGVHAIKRRHRIKGKESIKACIHSEREKAREIKRESDQGKREREKRAREEREIPLAEFDHKSAKL